MAQFTAQGRLKLLLNGDGISIAFTDAPSISPLQIHKRKLNLAGSAKTRVFASSSPSASTSPSKLPSLIKSSTHSAVHKSPNFGTYSDIFDEPEYESDELCSFRGLVLDISYRPINVVCWKRAICLEFMDKADVLEYYDQTVNSSSGSFYIPAVLRVPHLIQVVKRRRIRSTLSRKNVLARDNYICQYCCSTENLTIDHVLPISKGGEWTWENLVTACLSCNSRKGQKTLEQASMKLIEVPKAPKDYNILAIPLTGKAIDMLIRRKGTPEEWLQYLSKSSSEP